MRFQSLSVLLGLYLFQLPALAQDAEVLSEETSEQISSSDRAELSPDSSVSIGSLLESIETSSVNQNDYILGPGDEVEIIVFGYDEYTSTEVISTDGTISLPVVGSIHISDMTPDAAENKLAALLNTVLVNPSVTLSPSTMRPVMVTVAGEVRRPGPLQLEGLTNNGGNDALQNMPTLSAAISQAGGITSLADIRQVTLRRRTPEGREIVVEFDLWEAILLGNAPEDPILLDGDTVYIPQLTTQQEIDQRLIARSSLAPETIRVRVVGEVTRPGEVQVPPNSSLSSAVAIAGGPTEDARLNRVGFVRLETGGEVVRQEIDLSNLTDAHQVQDGDVIIVPKRSSSSFLDFAIRLLNPLDALFDIVDSVDNNRR